MTNIYNHQEQYYESIEFNVSTGTSNYQLTANQPTFLTNFGPNDNTPVGKYPSSIVIRTNQTITVALNKSTNMAITIASTDSPFVIKGMSIYDVFITNNSGQTAAVKLLFTANEN